MAENKKKTILIVEDDIFLVKAYQIKLKAEGFDTLLAKDGTEVMDFLKQEPTDLIILDLMLPGVSGFDVLEIIKKNSKWKNIPVLVVSNLGQEEDMEKVKLMGAKEYIIKSSVKISDIVEKIKKYL